MKNNFDILVIGGGAAGFFTAINCAEKYPSATVAILERGKEVLSKVRVSGGGRCNVTHACFVANDLVKNYPRGEKELKGPFHQFCSGDTVAWFEERGVKLKTESDGRMFPVSNSSQTIIDCFISLAKKHKIEILTQQSVQTIFYKDEYWKIETLQQQFTSEKLIVATGSNPKIWNLLQTLGHSIVEPVPSLFTFNITDKNLTHLMGISAYVDLKIQNTKLATQGPMLITHWGISGPAVLRLSAWGARVLADMNYTFTIQINWLVDTTSEDATAMLLELKNTHTKNYIINKPLADFPKRLWEYFLTLSNIEPTQKWADVTKKQLQKLTEILCSTEYIVSGKSTFKEEFVTAGGVNLKEINFKTMQSKLFSNLYFAGEVLNIDAITGGFNFQNAWTGGFIISEHLYN